MASDTPESTQIERSGQQLEHEASPAIPPARAWLERLAVAGSPAPPLAQLAIAAGSAVLVGALVVLSRLPLVPPPSPPVQALAALQPVKLPAPKPTPAPSRPAIEPALPVPVQAAVAPEPAAAPLLPPPPLQPAVPLQRLEQPAARHAQTTPKSHAKKPLRPPTSKPRRASAKRADSAASAALRRRRSAS